MNEKISGIVRAGAVSAVDRRAKFAGEERAPREHPREPARKGTEPEKERFVPDEKLVGLYKRPLKTPEEMPEPDGLAELVKDLTVRQGTEVNILARTQSFSPARTAAARAVLAPGGELCCERVCAKIADEIYAGSHPPDRVRSSLKEGFAAAARVFGGSLPLICRRTEKMLFQEWRV